MKSSALILVVGLVMASPAQADPINCLTRFQEQTNPRISDCLIDNTGATFASKACYTSFEPGQAGYNAQYQPPTCLQQPAVTLTQQQILQQAYQRAPRYVQERLCRLTGLYLVSSNSASFQSWGFWEAPDRPPPNDANGNPTRRYGSFIGVADALLNLASLAAEENKVQNWLLNPDVQDVPNLPSFIDDSSSGPPAAVLAVLAHELGHVLLADTNGDGTGGNTIKHDRSKQCLPPDPEKRCFETAFLGTDVEDKRWDAAKFHRSTRRWIKFAAPGQSPSNKHQNKKVDLSKVQNDVGRDNGRATDEINDIYGSGELVSLFAAASPEEDFVEAYKYKVLADVTGPSLSLTYTFPKGVHGNIDVLAPLRNPNPDLRGKIECLRTLGLLSWQ